MTDLAHNDEPADVTRIDESRAKGEALTWREIHDAAGELAQRHRGQRYVGVYGVPTGGAPVAILVAARPSNSRCSSNRSPARSSSTT